MSGSQSASRIDFCTPLPRVTDSLSGVEGLSISKFMEALASRAHCRVSSELHDPRTFDYKKSSKTIRKVRVFTYLRAGRCLQRHRFKTGARLTARHEHLKQRVDSPSLCNTHALIRRKLHDRFVDDAQGVEQESINSNISSGEPPMSARLSALLMRTTDKMIT